MDIDKAYIMGLSFDDNGKYRGWSPLFDYSSYKTLKASEKLAAPQAVEYEVSEEGIDISSELMEVINAEDSLMQNPTNEDLKVNRINAYAKLLDKLYDIEIKDGKIFVSYSGITEDNVIPIIEKLNQHSKYLIDNENIEDILKNIVSSGISEIIQNLRNMDMAYSPIIMTAMRKGANKQSKVMSLMNPLTKYSMQIENMVGKDGIGITAVGEKVFFALSNYWNAGIRSENSEWITNLRFKHTYNRLSQVQEYDSDDTKVSVLARGVLPTAIYNGHTEADKNSSMLSNVGYDVIYDSQNDVYVITTPEVVDIETLKKIITDFIPNGSIIIGLDQNILNNQIIKNRVRVDNKSGIIYKRGVRKGYETTKEISATKGTIDKECQKVFTSYRVIDRRKLVTKTTLANANFENYEALLPDFLDLNNEINEATQELNMDKVALIHAIKSEENIHPTIVRLREQMRELHNNYVYADDLISQLLSAATDNAKELILKKINADANLIKIYLHMIMMGINIEDSIQFMTSPAVKAVSNLLQSNMYDDYNTITYVNEAIKALNGIFSVGKFIYGTSKSTSYDEGPSKTVNNTDKLKDTLLQTSVIYGGRAVRIDELLEGLNLLRELNPKEKNDSIKLLDVIQGIFKAELLGINILENIKNINPFGWNKKMNQNYIGLLELVQRVLTLVPKGNSFYSFDSDLKQLSTLLEEADEMSTLGSTYLSFNQGIPVKQADILKKIVNIEKSVNKTTSERKIDMENREETIKSIIERQPWLSIEYVAKVLNAANKLGIIGEFNFKKWATDSNYREIASMYYNLIKYTYNILDVIERLPHFKSIFELFRSVTIMNQVNSKKNAMFDYIINDIRSKYNFVDFDSVSKLEDYIDNLILKNWLLHKGKTLTLQVGDQIVTRDWGNHTVTIPGKLHLDSDINLASFKKIFETRIIPQLKRGKLISTLEDGSIETIDINDNEFIRQLRFAIDKDNRVFLKLNLDMQNPDITESNSIKYQKCLNDFIKLKNVRLDGTSLTDWFMIYNFIVNKTKFGQDRMTTLFANFINIIREDSLIREYEQYIGDFDSSIQEVNSTFMKEIGYDIQDALFAISPMISKDSEHETKFPIIREIENGITVYKVRGKYGTYSETGTKLVQNSSDLNGDELKLDIYSRYYNMRNYGFMTNPISSARTSSRSYLKSNDVKLFTKALQYYIYAGYLNIKTDC